MTSRRSTRRARPTQLTLFSHGGKRVGAGRLPNGPKALVTHRTREELTQHLPALVTLKLCAGLPNLRRDAAFETALARLSAARGRFGCRVIHYSFQSNHVHLLVEADDAESLARGMQGLCVRLARGLNKLWNRKGRVFADRYHSRVNHTPKEVRNALVYVLQNARKHGVRSDAWRDGLDPCSSASMFDGWNAPPQRGRAGRHADPPVLQARSWLATSGWRRHGLIRVSEAPRSAA